MSLYKTANVVVPGPSLNSTMPIDYGDVTAMDVLDGQYEKLLTFYDALCGHYDVFK